MVAIRQELVTALIACAESPFRAKARRFVNGLSSDELQFIAEYIGARILESARPCRCSRAELDERIREFQQARRPLADGDHKSILLLEFLCRTGVTATPSARAHVESVAGL